MARWTPKKQALASQLPEGSEDVAFRKSQDGPTIVKAHAVILANQSDRFHGDFYPIRAGRTLPIVLCDWAQVLCDWAPITECEVALKAFVKMLYGTGPTLASLDIKTLLGVHSLATYYCIPGLVGEMVFPVFWYWGCRAKRGCQRQHRRDPQKHPRKSPDHQDQH